MNLFKLNAKVLLSVSEDQMESEEKYDLGNIARSKEWVWRNIAVPVEEVYKIIEFNKTKSIVQMRDDEKMLVNEKFDVLFDRWESLKQLEVDLEMDEEEPEDLDLSEEEDDDDEGGVLKN